MTEKGQPLGKHKASYQYGRVLNVNRRGRSTYVNGDNQPVLCFSKSRKTNFISHENELIGDDQR